MCLKCVFPGIIRPIFILKYPLNANLSSVVGHPDLVRAAGAAVARRAGRTLGGPPRRVHPLRARDAGLLVRVQLPGRALG